MIVRVGDDHVVTGRREPRRLGKLLVERLHCLHPARLGVERLELPVVRVGDPESVIPWTPGETRGVLEPDLLSDPVSVAEFEKPRPHERRHLTALFEHRHPYTRRLG